MLTSTRFPNPSSFTRSIRLARSAPSVPRAALACGLLLVASLGLADAAAATEPAAELGTEIPEIVSRSIEFHGGDLYQSSITRLDICSKSGCYLVRSRVDGNRFYHRVSGKTRRGHQIVRITNDLVEHSLDDVEQAVPESEEQRLRDWAMARVYFSFLPFRLEDPSVRFRDQGKTRWPTAEGGSRELHQVEVGFVAGSSTDSDDRYLYWFDPETARLEQFAYSYSGNPGGLRFRQLRNYRRVGGILFFDQINLGTESETPNVLDITPTFALSLRPISEVRLDNILVESIHAERLD